MVARIILLFQTAEFFSEFIAPHLDIGSSIRAMAAFRLPFNHGLVHAKFESHLNSTITMLNGFKLKHDPRTAVNNVLRRSAKALSVAFNSVRFTREFQRAFRDQFVVNHMRKTGRFTHMLMQIRIVFKFQRGILVAVLGGDRNFENKEGSIPAVPFKAHRFWLEE